MNKIFISFVIDVVKVRNGTKYNIMEVGITNYDENDKPVKRYRYLVKPQYRLSKIGKEFYGDSINDERRITYVELNNKLSNLRDVVMKTGAEIYMYSGFYTNINRILKSISLDYMESNRNIFAFLSSNAIDLSSKFSNLVIYKTNYGIRKLTPCAISIYDANILMGNKVNHKYFRNALYENDILFNCYKQIQSNKRIVITNKVASNTVKKITRELLEFINRYLKDSYKDSRHYIPLKEFFNETDVHVNKNNQTVVFKGTFEKYSLVNFGEVI